MSDPLPGPAPNYAYWQNNGATWADEYEQRRRQDPLYGLQEIVLAGIIERAGPAQVLEYGCGVGRHLSYLSKIPGIDMYGVDQSPTMLDGVRRWAPREWIAERVRLIQPVGPIPFPNQHFDLSFTAEVLVHVRPEDPEGRLRELLRVSRWAVFHMEPPRDYVLHAQAHEGCWYHDLTAAYARLGITAINVGRPIDAQELIVAPIGGAALNFLPGGATLAHMRAVEHWLRDSRTDADAPGGRAAAAAKPAPGFDIEELVALAPAPDRDAVESALEALPSGFRDRVEERTRTLEWFAGREVLPTDVIAQDWVMDWEAGDCAFAVAMLRVGAKRVVAIDSWMDLERLPPALSSFPGLFHAKTTVQELAFGAYRPAIDFDLVFANTVTEHLPDIVDSLAKIRRLLRLGGCFFTNHDNYYQPVGSHDHGFLNYRGLEIVPLGVACWQDQTRCAKSAEHRAQIVRDMPWTYSPKLEATRNPSFCEGCYYYRRSQPWAHLLHQERFRDTFGNESFYSGTKRSTLNKITIFQLRQMIIESGMDIVRSDRVLVDNEPPPELLAAPFHLNREDLRSGTAAILARA